MSAADRDETARLRAAWHDHVDADAAGLGDPVDADRVWRAVRGELPRAERRDLVDRLPRDPDLALSWRLARELSRAAEGLDDQSEADSDIDIDEVTSPPATSGDETGRVMPFPARSRRAWITGLALAAGLALAVIGLRYDDLGFGIDPDTPPATYRGGDEGIEALTAGTLDPADATLRWRGPEGARYAVTVMTADLEPVVTATDLDRSELALSAGVLASLGDGTTLLWQVEARLPNGETIVSETFRARWRSPAAGAGDQESPIE